MMKKTVCRFAAAAAAAMLCMGTMPASAADSAEMTFRMAADTTYFTESALASGDIVVDGGLYIDNYSGITEMKITMVSDAPISLENGDFTRDPSRTETENGQTVAKQCFFVSHGSTYYTNNDTSGNPINVALWYGPGSILPAAGVVDMADSSFLSYQVRIPKGTKAGVYRCYVDTSFDTAANSYNTFIYNGADKLSPVMQDCEIIVEPGAVRGDVNCDGSVTVLDAQRALQYYAAVMLSEQGDDDALLREILQTPYIHTAAEAVDATLDHQISISDPMAILRYSSQILSEQTPSWEAAVG